MRQGWIADSPGSQYTLLHHSWLVYMINKETVTRDYGRNSRDKKAIQYANHKRRRSIRVELVSSCNESSASISTGRMRKLDFLSVRSSYQARNALLRSAGEFDSYRL